MVERRSIIGLSHVLVAALVAGGLAGCVPVSGNTQSASQQDIRCGSLDAAVRPGGPAQLTAEQLADARSSVVLATEAGAGPVGTSSTPPSCVGASGGFRALR